MYSVPSSPWKGETRNSAFGLLTWQPRLAGVSQPKLSWVSRRYETHMSLPPQPPGRSLMK